MIKQTSLVRGVLRRALSTSTTAPKPAYRPLQCSGVAPRNGLALASPTVRLFGSSRNDYYYDSQSGKHIPVHDETHIDILVTTNNSGNNADQTGAMILSSEQLQAWASQGVSGVKLEYQEQSSALDITSLLQGLSIPEFFQFWLPHGTLAEPENMEDNHRIVQCVEYNSENKELMQSVLSDLASTRLLSAIVCRDVEDLDGMLTASEVVSTLDETKGGDYVYLAGQEGDAIVGLAEELCYLDVEGPTLKARMVIDLTRIQDDPEDAMNECMTAGINKFVVNPDRLHWVSNLVQEQGKSCNIQAES